MKEAVWIDRARSYVGTTEVKGAGTSPVIRTWLVGLKAWWLEDETPWCGTFVAACMRETGIKVPKHWYRALGWLDWGIPLHEPVHGCVVIYNRKGGGHVNFAVGEDEKGRIMGLGGNQGDKVSIAPFDKTRVAGYRWPSEYASQIMQPLSLLASNGQSASSNEA